MHPSNFSLYLLEQKPEYFQMTIANKGNSDFIDRLTNLVLEHIEEEQFGVSELADKVNMSRSNLLRRVKKETQISVSQFIRNVRLEEASKLLREGSLNVTEVSYRVGFGSPSYFVKCFHEYYGFSPGELGKQQLEEPEAAIKPPLIRRRRIILPAAFILILIFVFWYANREKRGEIEKSIAVLPFINESADSSNLYLINGLMESVLNNLQKIEDLRVLSRTSTEKFRNNPVPVKQISEELDVKYLVEGSGQKIGNKILLTVQLIDAHTDRHLWSQQYRREVTDIFDLQAEIAKNIAAEVEAIITPEEEKKIGKLPTDNYLAYDYFLHGMEELRKETAEGLMAALPLFSKAIHEDPDFSLAYSFTAIAYYYMDILNTEKLFLDSMNYYADKALLLDPEFSYNLLARGLYYINAGEYELALPYLEKAHSQNPNEIFVLNVLTDFFTNRIPDTHRYLEYALKGLRQGVPTEDSSSISYMYLHLGNAFIQSGFTDEASKYLDLSLDYDPNNLYSMYVIAYVDYTRHFNLEKLREDLLAVLEKDETRLDVIQEVAKVYYFERDFEHARQYYDHFNAARDAYSLNIYPFEDSKIAVVYDKTGELEKSKKYFESFLKVTQESESIYRHLNFAAYYAYHSEEDLALEELDAFSNEENFHYWVVLFLDKEPLFESIVERKEFKALVSKIQSRFWERHEETRERLQDENLI